MDGKLHAIHAVWISAFPAEMTILRMCERFNKSILLIRSSLPVLVRWQSVLVRNAGLAYLD
jgi:hypothetical protein